MAFLLNTANPGNLIYANEARAVSSSAGFKSHFATASDLGQLEKALAEIAREAPDALICAQDTFLQSHAGRIAEFAVQHRLPLMVPTKEFVQAGALTSYGIKLPDQ